PALLSQGAEAGETAILGGAKQAPIALANAQASPVNTGEAPASSSPGSGLLGMTLNDVVLLKMAGGPDVMDAWTLAQQGIKQDAGATYIDPITGQTRYIPKVG